MTTIDFYNRHAAEFYANTIGVDMGQVYAAFLPLVRPGGRILDLGCGSGRDSRSFLDRGYQVTALDASAGMVRLATQSLQQPVLHRTFQQIDFREEFDGIWACASLLHVPRAEIDDVMRRIARALVRGGVAYLSFKYGDSEGERDGRWFNSYDEAGFTAVLERQPTLVPMRLWRSNDVRPGRVDEYWLNLLLRKV